jgi:hypothetical protein
VAQILAWADAWFESRGEWPHVASGPIPGTDGESWKNLESNLRRGERGLPYRSTLAQLLAEHRGARNHMRLPPMTVAQILAWADAYHRATGAWPKYDTGAIVGAPGETWHAVEAALRSGLRGLPGGSSLAQLLAEQRGVRNEHDLPRLTQRQVLAWADAHHRRTGAWPTSKSGPIPEAPGEKWMAVHTALADGLRGFPGGSSLPRLLARRRGVRNLKDLPRRSIPKVLAWADAHHRRTGQWPTLHSGAIPGVRGETWAAIDAALRHGRCGLPGGSSLARLLARHRGVPNRKDLPPLTEEQILAWADAHYARTGAWPAKRDGPIAEAPGTTWLAVDTALHKGGRGWPGGSTLRRLLHLRRPSAVPPAAGPKG